MKNYLGIIPKYFILNRKRMVFTIIGIILSIMLMTALSVMIDGDSAGRAENIKNEKGYYHLNVKNLNKGQLEVLRKTESIEKLGHEERRGDYYIEGHEFAVSGAILDIEAIEMFRLELVSGSFPVAENEIAVNETISKRIKPAPKPGDTILLKGVNKNIEQEFIISGIYKSDYYPFYNAAIMSNNCPQEIVDGLKTNKTYIKFKEGVNVKEEFRSLAQTADITSANFVVFNSELLTAMGQQIDWSNLVSKLIFSLIICLATIAAIYNVFYISVIERIKHYGILRSVGSSPKQIRRLVIVEGLLLAFIALPFGLLLGILLAWGMHIYMPDVISNSAKFIVLPRSLIITALIGLFTIFLSTIKPAKVAGRISPIEAISNTGYKLGKEKIKVRRWQSILNKITGISGLMAYRNLWRNKKRFLVTVFSMCLCSVMFIAFTYLLATTFEIAEKDYKVPMTYSIVMNSSGKGESGLCEEEYRKAINISGIERVEGLRYLNFAMLERNKDQVGEGFKQKQNYAGDNIQCQVIGVENEVIQRAVLKSGNIQDVLRGDKNSVIVVNNWPANSRKTGLLKQFEVGEEITFSIWDPINNKAKNYNVKVAAIANDSPSYWGRERSNDIKIIFKNSNFSKMFELQDYQKYDIYTARDANKDKIYKELSEISGTIPGSVVMYYEKIYKDGMEQVNKIKAFYLGIIGILSLIGVFNIFNSISAGLIMRTREFATLKAVGMTDKQIRANVSLEGLFHGLISSIWGAIIGSAIAYIYYCIINTDIGDVIWQIPWLSIIIATSINIIVCVLATAAPLKKISKMNIIEGIRTLD